MMKIPNIFRCSSGEGGPCGQSCCDTASKAHTQGCGCCHNCNNCDSSNGCTDGSTYYGVEEKCKNGRRDGCADSTCTDATCNPCYGCQGCNSCYSCNGTCNGCNTCNGCQTCIDCQSCNACQSCNTSCYEENSGYDRSCDDWYAGSRRTLNRSWKNCLNSCSTWY